MAISRQKKEELIQIYQEGIERSSAIILTRYRGVSVPKIQSLRSKLGETGSTYMVVKNTLLSIALERAGRKIDSGGLLAGPNAVMFVGEDIGAGVKALKDWIKQDGIVEIHGAILESSVLDATGADALADLPTREEMLAKLLGTINAPASNLARIIAAPSSSLARVIQAHVDEVQPEAA